MSIKKFLVTREDGTPIEEPVIVCKVSEPYAYAVFDIINNFEHICESFEEFTKQISAPPQWEHKFEDEDEKYQGLDGEALDFLYSQLDDKLLFTIHCKGSRYPIRYGTASSFEEMQGKMIDSVLAYVAKCHKDLRAVLRSKEIKQDGHKDDK